MPGYCAPWPENIMTRRPGPPSCRPLRTSGERGSPSTPPASLMLLTTATRRWRNARRPVWSVKATSPRSRSRPCSARCRPSRAVAWSRAVSERAAGFRHHAADLPDWHAVLAVSHWGFIRGLTGHRVPNAAVLRFDPRAPHPTGAEILRPRDAALRA